MRLNLEELNIIENNKFILIVFFFIIFLFDVDTEWKFKPKPRTGKKGFQIFVIGVYFIVILVVFFVL